MIFALFDYVTYVRRTGRYSRDVRRSLMGGAAFQCATPPIKAIELLRPGDVLLVQTLDSRISWLIMYLTTSDISHVATYLGDGKIAHATYNGVTIDPIESLFDENARVLPTHWDWTDSEREMFATNLVSYLGMPYGWSVVLTKGLSILSARDWPYFRWRFAIDIALLIALLDLPALLILDRAFFTLAIPAYCLLIAVNWARWKIWPLKFSELTGKPCDMFSIIKESGGTFIFDAYELAQQRKRNSPANP